MKGLAMPMCLIVTAQELRRALGDPLCTETIDCTLAEIEHDFLKPELRCVLETVGPEGEFLDTFDGRMVCPGHALEVGWFILEEARLRQRDPRLIQLGTKIVDWSFEIGWDREYGGILYYRDARGLPCTEYWQDMKFWWPHNEAIIACLLAWLLAMAAGRGALAGLALVALGWYLVRLYYGLETSLLGKGLALMATGAVLVCLQFGLRRLSRPPGLAATAGDIHA